MSLKPELQALAAAAAQAGDVQPAPAPSNNEIRRQLGWGLVATVECPR